MAGNIPDFLTQNIEQLVERQKETERRQTLQIRIADAITRFTGSLAFVWLHVAWIGGWIVSNLGLIPGFAPFDPFPFALLTMIGSLEAIFLSTFVLISQNRMQAAADRRAELDLHISLLAERESSTILLKLARIEDRLGIEVPSEEHEATKSLVKVTDPTEIAEEIDRVLDGPDNSDDRAA
jgi:uncharacterized membrane protein